MLASPAKRLISRRGAQALIVGARDSGASAHTTRRALEIFSRRRAQKRTRFMLQSKSILAALIAAPLALGSVLPVSAQAQELPIPSGAYALDPTHASVTWKISHLGLSNYTARFTQFDIALTLDTENPANSSVTATIDPTSVETDYPGEKDFDGEVANDAKFLNAGAFPAITFTSTSVEPTGDNTAKVTGDLTMLGVTKPVTLDVTLNSALEQHPFAKKPAVGFSAVGALDRTEWGLTHLSNTLGEGGNQIVGSSVQVLIEAEFVKAE